MENENTNLNNYEYNGESLNESVENSVGFVGGNNRDITRG